MSRRRQKKRSQRDELRRRKGGGLRKAAAVLLGVALVCTALAAGLLFSGLIGGDSGPRRAAIVDQLSLTQPNPDFAESATNLLEQAGYTVDYFPGEEVTVELYRNLPTHGYGLIVLRVHSGLTREVSEEGATPREYVSLFTGEAYNDTKYPDETFVAPGEPVARLGSAVYYKGAPPLFGIAPGFIKESMKGKFDDTTVILMGCDGLKSHDTGQAFLDRGAGAFVSWTQAVTASHSDAATLRLLEKLVSEGLPLADAVAQTAAEVGPDPLYGAELRMLPEGG